MEQEVLKHLGGRKLLENKLCARSFLMDCVFDGKEIEVGFSFLGNKNMNFVTVEKLKHGYKYLTNTYYRLYFYKVSWFKVVCIQTISEVTKEKVREAIGVALNIDL